MYTHACSYPRHDLRIALIPLDIHLGDKAHNIAAAKMHIDDVGHNADIVVLPELFSTGFGDFQTTPSSLAETMEGPTISAMCEISASHDGLAIAGGFLREKDGQLFNSAFIVADGKLLTVYDKRHLFAGPEQKIFQHGMKEPEIVEFRGWRLRLAICYDLRFPVWNRSVDCGYDALIVVANWPHSRFYAWKHLVIARAIENQAYVAACNREGKDIYGEYRRGDSIVANAMGYIIDEKTEEGFSICTLEASRLQDDRKNLQPWRVADDFKLYL